MGVQVYNKDFLRELSLERIRVNDNELSFILTGKNPHVLKSFKFKLSKEAMTEFLRTDNKHSYIIDKVFGYFEGYETFATKPPVLISKESPVNKTCEEFDKTTNG
jgi:hypothetical protein